jgi:hypothetical protein
MLASLDFVREHSKCRQDFIFLAISSCEQLVDHRAMQAVDFGF